MLSHPVRRCWATEGLLLFLDTSDMGKERVAEYYLQNEKGFGENVRVNKKRLYAFRCSFEATHRRDTPFPSGQQRFSSDRG